MFIIPFSPFGLSASLVMGVAVCSNRVAPGHLTQVGLRHPHRRRDQLRLRSLRDLRSR